MRYHAFSLYIVPRAVCPPCTKELSLSVKIRLARHGSKKNPYYRIVVADNRVKRDGHCIEEVGRYNPMVEPSMVKLDLEKVDAWVAKGAQPTDTVARLIKEFREPKPATEKPKKMSKKAAAKAAAAAAEAAEQAE